MMQPNAPPQLRKRPRSRLQSSTAVAVVLALAVALAGCTSVSRYKLDAEFDSSPVKTRTKLTEALQCLGGQLENNRQNPGAYAFMVRDIIDGTVKNLNSADGPLSDAGRIQMVSILTAHTKPSYGMVLDAFPTMLRPVINENIGLNRFGLPLPDDLSTFVANLTRSANMSRRLKGMPTVDSVMPLIIDGAFTRYDSSHIRSKGYGANAGYRGDIEDEESLSIDFGDSGSERSVTLVVNVIDPKNNTVVGTESFDLKFYSNSKTARFRVAIDEYYYGFSNTDVTVETVHAAQQTLLEAGAIWILDNAYGAMVDFSPCFDTEEKLALGQDARYAQVQAARDNGSTTPAAATAAIALGIDTIENPVATSIDIPALATETETTPVAAQTAATQLGDDTIENPVATSIDTPALESQVADAAGGLESMAIWRVGAGAFCDIGNAASRSLVLETAGYDVSSSMVKISDCDATQLWIGPFAEEGTAKEISQHLGGLIGEYGFIIHAD